MSTTPAAEQYIRVPALDQEYTHDLSFWKHRVIRQAVLAEQDRVDMAALGQAKRKIQQVVEAGRQRKRQHTRTRIARWDTAGKPTRQVTLAPTPQANQADLAPAAHQPSGRCARKCWRIDRGGAKPRVGLGTHACTAQAGHDPCRRG